MAIFFDYKPKNGLRQPRIIYRVDDPAMAPLEELRRVGGAGEKGSMNALYLEALVAGAGILLARLSVEGRVPAETRVPSPSAAAPQLPAPSVTEQSPLPGPALLQPASVADTRSPNSAPSVVVTTPPPFQEPRIGRSPSHSSAAMAQFNRFGAP